MLGNPEVSDSSEDIPILSSGEEIVTEKDCMRQDGAAQVTGSGTSHQLTINDFERCMVVDLSMQTKIM